MSRNGDVDAKARGSRGSTLNSPLIPRSASGILPCFLNSFMNGKGLSHLGRGRISWNTRQRLGAVGSALLKWQMPLLHRIL